VRSLLNFKGNNYYKFSVCASSRIYPACKVNASRYIVICSLSSGTIFFHILLHTAQFSEKKKKSNECYEFLYNFFSETFLVLRIIERYTNIRRSPSIRSVILAIF